MVELTLKQKIPEIFNHTRQARTLLSWLICLFIHVNITGQRIVSAEFLIGVGSPELFHTGARFKIAEQTKLGVMVGIWPGLSSTPVILEGEAQFHLVGEKRNLEFNTWFLRTGWIYGETPENNHVREYSGPYVGIGREWIGRGNLGVQLDAGIYLLPYQVRKYEFFTNRMKTELMGGFRFQFFYRSSRFQTERRKR